MGMPEWPTLSREQDSQFYEVSLEDPALKTAMEGGYVVSRPKHTRKPRRSFKTGYSGITNADRVLLEAFYDSVRGGSLTFTWRDPVSKTAWIVRFGEKLGFKYVGVGISQRWDVQISLDQA